MFKYLMSLLVYLCAAQCLLALPKSSGAEVRDSTITNVNTNSSISARDRSAVNTGIQARGATIVDSTLENKFTGTVNASGNSKVSTGIKADNAHIRNSEIRTDTKANITASGAEVKTGVDVREAVGSKIKTTYEGNIDAHGATVKAGAVEGEVRYKKVTTEVKEDISAYGRGVEIGTVKGGGGQASYHESDKNYGTKSRAGAKIGTVEVDSATVREVNTSVGSNNLISGMKTKHMAQVYAENGGVDPSGTKHVYVSEKEKERAKKTGGSVGNTVIHGGGKVRKVNTFVE